MNGQEGVVECAYIQSDVTEAKYFATPLVLGPNGVTKNLGLGTLTPFEQVGIKIFIAFVTNIFERISNIFISLFQDLLKAAIPELNGSIKKGEKFVEDNY